MDQELNHNQKKHKRINSAHLQLTTQILERGKIILGVLRYNAAKSLLLNVVPFVESKYAEPKISN